MAKPFRTIAGACSALAASLTAAPACAAPEIATANAVVQVDDTALLENLESLEFGKIAKGATGGAVTISAATNATTSVGSVAPVGTLRHRAVFLSRAPIGTVFLMNLDPSVTLTRAGGTETMTATLTRATGPGLLSVNVFFLPIGLKAITANQYIYVGGTLTVPAGQATGAYTGQFDLTVSYL